MLEFVFPYYLILLSLGLIVWLLYWLDRKSQRKKISRLGSPGLVEPLMPGASKYKHKIKAVLRITALLSIIVVLSRPIFGEAKRESVSEGSELVIVIDLSNSMYARATDLSGSQSRLQRAKMLLQKLIKDRGNDKVAIIAFAGSAKMAIPMTSDATQANLVLNDLDPAIMTTQGTDIRQALEAAELAFPDMNLINNEGEITGQREKDLNKPVHRAIILLTDAEDHEGGAIEMAQSLAKNNIQLDVIAMGTSKGAPVIMPDGTTLKDEDGNDVSSPVNLTYAQDLAKAGGGVFVEGTSSDAVEKINQALDKLAKSKIKQVEYSMSAEQFPLFAWLALILLCLDAMISTRKNSWLRKVEFFGRKGSRTSSKVKIMIGMVVLTGFMASCSSRDSERRQTNKTERNAVKTGNGYFNKEEYSKAIESYDIAIAANPESERAMYNKALTTLFLESPDTTALKDARLALDSLIKLDHDPDVVDNALYTLGNDAVYIGDALMEKSKEVTQSNPVLADSLKKIAVESYHQAINNYKVILRTNPKDVKTLQNLRVAQLKLPPADNNSQDQQDQDKDDNKTQQPPEPDPESEQQQQQQQQQNAGLNAVQERENRTRDKKQKAVTPVQQYKRKPW